MESNAALLPSASAERPLSPPMIESVYQNCSKLASWKTPYSQTRALRIVQCKVIALQLSAPVLHNTGTIRIRTLLCVYVQL